MRAGPHHTPSRVATHASLTRHLVLLLLRGRRGHAVGRRCRMLLWSSHAIRRLSGMLLGIRYSIGRRRRVLLRRWRRHASGQLHRVVVVHHAINLLRHESAGNACSPTLVFAGAEAVEPCSRVCHVLLGVVLLRLLLLLVVLLRPGDEARSGGRVLHAALDIRVWLMSWGRALLVRIEEGPGAGLLLHDGVRLLRLVVALAVALVLMRKRRRLEGSRVYSPLGYL